LIIILAIVFVGLSSNNYFQSSTSQPVPASKTISTGTDSSDQPAQNTSSSSSGSADSNTGITIKPIDESNTNTSISDLKISILDGSATKTSDQIEADLQNLGYEPATVTIAQGPIGNSMIYFKDKAKETAELLKTKLSRYSFRTEESSVVGLDDILIVIGKQ